MDNTPLLRLRDITRTYTEDSTTTALKRIDLDVFSGDFLAIEGPSGGGKSTLLNIIGLLDSPSSGSYQIAGLEASNLSEDERARMRRKRFAFVFQSFHLLDRRPVVDSVELGMLYCDVPAEHRRARALDALQKVGLGPRAFYLAAMLSGGERQRVAIARALASAGPILIADEPTGNLDSENTREIMTNLRRLNESGTTILLVTHSPEVAALASRRINIRDGKMSGHSGGGASGGPVLASGGALTEDVISDAQRSEAGVPKRRAARRLRDVFVDASASIHSRRGRTAGLASAVSVGVALFVGTLGISGSATAQVSSAFDAQTNRDVTVTWPGASTTDLNTQERRTLVRRLGGLSGVDSAGILASAGQITAQAAPTRSSFDIDGYTITAEVTKAARLSVRWASPARRALRSGEVLIGKALAKRMELGPLEGVPTILVDHSAMTVAGIIEKSPRFPELLGGITRADSDNVHDAESQQYAVILTRPGAAPQVSRQAPLVIYPYDTARLTVDSPIDPRSLRIHVQQELQSTLFALTGVALLAAIAGLANSMTTSVLERKHEFGLRRAVGATAGRVRNLVLAEATLIGAVGGAIGLAVGLAGILAITVVQRWSPVLDLSLAPLAVVGGVLVGVSSGAFAARRASKIQPHEALRS